MCVSEIVRYYLKCNQSQAPSPFKKVSAYVLIFIIKMLNDICMNDNQYVSVWL